MAHPSPGYSISVRVETPTGTATAGKLEVVSRAALRNRDDLSRAYTPGVARVSREIAANPSSARALTVKGNTIAVVTDGSAALGGCVPTDQLRADHIIPNAFNPDVARDVANAVVAAAAAKVEQVQEGQVA